MQALGAKCAGCHAKQAGEMAASGHAMTYAQSFLNREHNRMEPPMDDCLRCHAMFFDGAARDLVKPLNSRGPWRMVDEKLGGHRSILLRQLPPGSSRALAVIAVEVGGIGESHRWHGDEQSWLLRPSRASVFPRRPPATREGFQGRQAAETIRRCAHPRLLPMSRAERDASNRHRRRPNVARCPRRHELPRLSRHSLARYARSLRSVSSRLFELRSGCDTHGYHGSREGQPARHSHRDLHRLPRQDSEGAAIGIRTACKKIRDDKGYWEQVDVYIHKHTPADISHSVCPECMKAHYPTVGKAQDSDKK